MYWNGAQCCLFHETSGKTPVRSFSKDTKHFSFSVVHWYPGQLSFMVPLCICALLITVSHQGTPQALTQATGNHIWHSHFTLWIAWCLCMLINFTLNPLKAVIHQSFVFCFLTSADGQGSQLEDTKWATASKEVLTAQQVHLFLTNNSQFGATSVLTFSLSCFFFLLFFPLIPCSFPVNQSRRFSPQSTMLHFAQPLSRCPAWL